LVSAVMLTTPLLVITIRWATILFPQINNPIIPLVIKFRNATFY